MEASVLLKRKSAAATSLARSPSKCSAKEVSTRARKAEAVGEREEKEERRAEESRIGESCFGEEELESFFETRVAGDRTVEEEETIRTIENTMAI